MKAFHCTSAEHEQDGFLFPAEEWGAERTKATCPRCGAQAHAVKLAPVREQADAYTPKL